MGRGLEVYPGERGRSRDGIQGDVTPEHTIIPHHLSAVRAITRYALLQMAAGQYEGHEYGEGCQNFE